VTALYAVGDLQAAREQADHFQHAARNFYPFQVLRALVLADLGAREDARALVRELLRRGITNATELFMVAGAMELLGDPETASAAVREFAERDVEEVFTEQAGVSPHGAALQYFLGKYDTDRLRASTGGTPGLQCEFAFYVALRELGRGNRDAGLHALRESVGTGVFIYGEYRLAQSLLERARIDPSWPRWVQQN
jgi:hypothetical protein